MTAEEIPYSFLVALWKKTGGKAWEPPDMNCPTVKRLIDAGYVRRCTMRCGFEAFDTGLQWTEAGKLAVRSILEGNPHDQ